MIDIIIPVYNSRKYLPRALTSIQSQINVPEITVVIVDDGSIENYDDILFNRSDKLNIKYYRLEENMGPGKAREYGLNHSSSDFIIFLDSDDVFYNELSVKTLYDAIENYDVVRSVIHEETDEGFNVYKNENIGLHGKIYRRSFINKNGIYFNNTRSNEDTGFNALIQLCGARYNDISDVTYIWCNNKSSITRENREKYHDVDLENYALNMKWAIEEAYKKLYFNDLVCLIDIVELYKRFINAFSEETKNNISNSAYDIYSIYKNETNNNILNSINDIRLVSYDKTILNNAFNWIIVFDNQDEFKQINNTVEDERIRDYHIELMNRYNATPRTFIPQRKELMQSMFASVGLGVNVETPFNANWGGKNLHLGNRVFINYNLSLVDDGNIFIEDNVFIGPNVTLITLTHDFNPAKRLAGYVKIEDVTIKKNAWLCANVTVLPGVTIGENSIIGAGSVVTKDIPPHVMAYGNPCRVVKQLDI